MFQPLFLFVVLVELVMTLLMVFGFELEYEGEALVSMQLLGGSVRDQLQVIIDSITSTSFTLTTHILMFLLILMSSSFYPDLLRNPLLSIVLTKPLSREALFLSRFAGLLIPMSANILLFSAALSIVLFMKGAGSVYASLMAGAVSFCVEFLLLFSFCAFLTMVVDHSFGTAVVAAGMYYLVGPLIANTDVSSPVVTRVFSFLLPPTGTLSRATRELVLDGSGNFGPLIAVLPYAALYIAGGAFLFHRKDLR